MVPNKLAHYNFIWTKWRMVSAFALGFYLPSAVACCQQARTPSEPTAKKWHALLDMLDMTMAQADYYCCNQSSASHHMDALSYCMSCPNPGVNGLKRPTPKILMSADLMFQQGDPLQSQLSKLTYDRMPSRAVAL